MLSASKTIYGDNGFYRCQFGGQRVGSDEL